MYKALLRPHLDYCDIVYHKPAQQNPPPLGITLNSLMEKVESIQYQAAIAVTGSWQGSSRTKLYEELGWETLSDRRMCRRILQIHKINSNMTPPYLKGKLPTHVIPLPGGNERPTFHNLKCRTSRYMDSFFPNAITSWNNFFEVFDIVNIPSFCILKNHLLSSFRPKKKSVFGIHDSLGIRYLFQLRVNLSPLRSHKRRHNFIDTPSDTCLCNQGIEDSSHFLFTCPIYAAQRATLAVSVITILQKNKPKSFRKQCEIVPIR